MSQLRFVTAGESHGAALTAILDGMPAGLRISRAEIDAQLARRQKGYGRGGRMKIETDHVEVLSGLRFGETLGSPITLQVVNRDFANWTERMNPFGAPTGEPVTAVRPGHADLTGVLKYDRHDARDILERSSARETTMRVAVGAICRQLLAAVGVTIVSHVTEIGGMRIDRAAVRDADIGVTNSDDLNVCDSVAAEQMKARIDEAKAAGDTLGGVFEIVVRGLPIGLGSHTQWDARLDGKIAGAVMSIQAIKGVEIGAGFVCAHLPGIAIHDEIYMGVDGRPYRATNRAGGLEGGMTNGEPLVVRAAMKPIPTLMTPLKTVDLATGAEVLASKERSDTCAVPAASVVGEAMVSFVLADAICTQFHADSMTDLRSSIAAYHARLESVWGRA
ncbi:chorismate synthase [Selenomonas infelix ATCC 43532]|uniref:Chorismate synthase n=1 Tax=Selenomonas infelix ATCC 43532 TaxID=679201 RepID=G5GR49_9FIRM|nr:chorismate synthase [Selenomonas infelix]EHG19909.1 chorismate synthase [Selenomonas infelix ATCC 43532]